MRQFRIRSDERRQDTTTQTRQAANTEINQILYENQTGNMLTESGN